MAPIEEALDLYLAALERRGFPLPADPVADEDLHAVEEAVAPMRLPAELVALWRRFQAGDTAIIDGLPLLSARSSVWLRDSDLHMGAHLGVVVEPQCLLVIASESRSRVLIELDGPDDTGGGRIWRSHLEDENLELAAESLAEMLEASAIGWDRRLLAYYGNWSVAEDWDGWRALLAERIGRPVRVDRWRKLEWPERWQRLCGLDLSLLEPRGATTTVAELKAGVIWSASAPATIVGRYVTLMGSGGGGRVRIDDGTAALEAWFPSDIDPFGVAASRDALLEFDLVPGGGGPRAAEIVGVQDAVSSALAAGDIEGGGRFAADIYGFLGPSASEAVVVAVRPAATRGQ